MDDDIDRQSDGNWNDARGKISNKFATIFPFLISMNFRFDSSGRQLNLQLFNLIFFPSFSGPLEYPCLLVLIIFSIRLSYPILLYCIIFIIFYSIAVYWLIFIESRPLSLIMHVRTYAERASRLDTKIEKILNPKPKVILFPTFIDLFFFKYPIVIVSYDHLFFLPVLIFDFFSSCPNL